MKSINFCALIAVAMTMSFHGHAATIESDAKIHESVPRDIAVKLANYVEARGYSCKTISAVTPFAFSRGFHVYCHQWQYHYEVEDKGGNWIVTVK